MTRDVPDDGGASSPGAPRRPELRGILGFEVRVEPTATRCKHARATCDPCGTSGARDALHATVGGRGVVARLREGASGRGKGARR